MFNQIDFSDLDRAAKQIGEILDAEFDNLYQDLLPDPFVLTDSELYEAIHRIFDEGFDWGYRFGMDMIKDTIIND
jgi:hypothetical protein